MYKILVVLLCVGCISWASCQKPDKTNEINSKSRKIDPVLRRALLKAITELENEQTDLPEFLDSTTENEMNSDDFQEENETLETSDISQNINDVDQSENVITPSVDSKLNVSEVPEMTISYRSYSVDGQKALDNEAILEPKEVKEIALKNEAERILLGLKLEKSESKNIIKNDQNNDDDTLHLSESRNIEKDKEQDDVEEESLPTKIQLKTEDDDDDSSLPTELRNFDEEIEEEEETIEGKSLPKNVDDDDSSELHDDLNDYTKKEIKEVTEMISQIKRPLNNQNKNSIQNTERPVIKRKKSTTEKPILTTKPSHNSDGENIETLENVQVFQAPLVAAFTVHQDINGSPKKVIPIYKQAQRRPLDPALALNAKVKHSSSSVQEPSIGLQSLRQSNSVNHQLTGDINPLVPSIDLNQQQYQPLQQNVEIPSPILQEPKITIQASVQPNYGQQQLIGSANPAGTSKEQQYRLFQQQLEQKTRLLEEHLIELQKQQRYHEEILKQQHMLQIQIESQIQPRNQPGGHQLNSFRLQQQPINNVENKQNLEPLKQQSVQVVQNEQQTIRQIQPAAPQPLRPTQQQQNFAPIQQLPTQPQNFVRQQQPIQTQQTFVQQQQSAQPQQNIIQQQQSAQPQQNIIQQQLPTQPQQNFVQQPAQPQQNFIQQPAQPQQNFIQQQQPAQPQQNFIQQQQPAQPQQNFIQQQPPQPQQNFVQQQQPTKPQQNFVQQQQQLQKITPQQSTQQAIPQQNIVNVQQQQLQEPQRPIPQVASVVAPQQNVLPPSSFSIQPSISAQAFSPNIDLQLPEKEAVDFLNYLRVFVPNQQPAPFNQQSSQVPTLSLLPPHNQQQLPIYAPFQNNFNVPLKQNILQQQLPIEKSYQNTFASPVQQNLHQQQLPKEKSFINFNSPIIQNPSSNRVFRHDSGTGNLGFNNGFNYINYYPTNTNRNIAQQHSRYMADNKLQSLLFQSGLTSGGKSQEDLSIVSKVLALNHGFPPRHYFN